MPSNEKAQLTLHIAQLEGRLINIKDKTPESFASNRTIAKARCAARLSDIARQESLVSTELAAAEANLATATEKMVALDAAEAAE
jgi:hypothetical protein